MINKEIQLGSVSDTALIIAYIRGKESEKDDAKFQDPLALKLCGNKMEGLIGESNRSWSSKALSKSLTNSVVVRTVLIDELIDQAIKENGIERIVNLGAGLDTRPYRMDLPSNIDWVEVDFKSISDYKKEKLQDNNPRCKITHIPRDISSKSQLEELFSIVLAENPSKTLVLTEGLLVYLKQSEVIELSQFLKKYDYVKYWVTDVYSPLSIRLMKKVWSSRLGREVQFFFGTKDSKEFFSSLGWDVKDFMPVFEHNERIGRTSSLNNVRKLFLKLFGDKFKKLVQRSSVVLGLEKT